MFHHLTIAWRSGLRSRSFQVFLLLGLLAAGAAYLAAEFSGRQPATVALDVGISAIRFVCLILVLSWCQDLIGKDIDKRTVFLALAYPLPRSAYLVGRYLGILLLLLVSLVLLSTVLLIPVAVLMGGYKQATAVVLTDGYVVTQLYVFLDLMVVAAFAVLITSFSTTHLLPLVLGLAFAIAGRSLGPVLSYLHDKNSGAADLASTYGPIIDSFKWILPDLSRLDVRAAALYGQWPGTDVLVGSAAMALSYAMICILVAIWVFRRREFN